MSSDDRRDGPARGVSIRHDSSSVDSSPSCFVVHSARKRTELANTLPADLARQLACLLELLGRGLMGLAVSRSLAAREKCHLFVGTLGSSEPTYEIAHSCAEKPA
jgi:hypothetical protein